MIKRFIAALAAAAVSVSCIYVPVFAAKAVYTDNEYSYYDDYEDDSDDDEISESYNSHSSDHHSSESSATYSDDDVAEPKHDFSYSAIDTDSALYDGNYYYNENAYFKDEACVFGENADNSEIHKLIQSTANEIGINVGIFIGGLYRNDKQTETFAAISNETLFGTDWDTNSIFLYLDFEGHKPSYDYIDTYHDAKLYYTDSTSGIVNRIDDIIEDMYVYLPSSGSTIYRSKVISAINAFLNDLKKYKKRGYVLESCYYNEEKDCYRYNFFGNIIETPFRPYKFAVVFLVIGLFLGIIIALLRAKSVRRTYKFRETVLASAYTSQQRIQFVNAQDIFLHEHTSRVRIESSSGGGGHGGGGFSGGGSHGGGGGHR